MNHVEQEQLLELFKALADKSRLHMVGVLGQGERSVGDLATLLDLSEPTVSHHLTRLREAGLVNLRTEGNHRFYRLNTARLGKLKQLVGDIEHLPPVEKVESDDRWIDQLDLPEWDRKVLHDYIANGRLTQIPMQQKKKLVILRWLATQFQPDVMYSEREVNAILTRHEEDYATLRRDLVDFGFLRRERGGGKYWLAPEDEASTAN
jgi:DNA-binding HxlR family transcriptional regulator